MGLYHTNGHFFLLNMRQQTSHWFSQRGNYNKASIHEKSLCRSQWAVSRKNWLNPRACRITMSEMSWLLFMQLYTQYKRLLVEDHCAPRSENGQPILNHHNSALFKSAANADPYLILTLKCWGSSFEDFAQSRSPEYVRNRKKKQEMGWPAWFFKPKSEVCFLSHQRWKPEHHEPRREPRASSLSWGLHT